MLLMSLFLLVIRIGLAYCTRGTRCACVSENREDPAASPVPHAEGHLLADRETQMKRFFGVLAFVAVVAPGIAAAGSATCGAGLTSGANIVTRPDDPLKALVFVEGLCFDLTSSIAREGKLSVLPPTTIETQFGTIRVNATFNSDPFITFGTTTTNAVPGPVTYEFLFATPIVPGFYNTATSTGGVTVTNGASGTSTVNINPGAPYILPSGSLGAVNTLLGVNLGDTPCTAGPGAPSTVTQVCNQGSRQHTSAPAFYDNLEVVLSYTQSDASSVASWSGAVTLTNTVPEPTSMVLVAVGIVAVAASYRVRGRGGPRV
jgi:hypothetical protein